MSDEPASGTPASRYVRIGIARAARAPRRATSRSSPRGRRGTGSTWPRRSGAAPSAPAPAASGSRRGGRGAAATAAGSPPAPPHTPRPSPPGPRRRTCACRSPSRGRGRSGRCSGSSSGSMTHVPRLAGSPRYGSKMRAVRSPMPPSGSSLTPPSRSQSPPNPACAPTSSSRSRSPTSSAAEPNPQPAISMSTRTVSWPFALGLLVAADLLRRQSRLAHRRQPDAVVLAAGRLDRGHPVDLGRLRDAAPDQLLRTVAEQARSDGRRRRARTSPRTAFPPDRACRARRRPARRAAPLHDELVPDPLEQHRMLRRDRIEIVPRRMPALVQQALVPAAAEHPLPGGSSGSAPPPARRSRRSSGSRTAAPGRGRGRSSAGGCGRRPAPG